jgi:predicted ester cyclase
LSTERNKAVIQKWIEEGWNKGKVDIADEIYALNFTAIEPDDSAKILQGPEDIKKSVIALRSAFPDIHFTIDYLIAEDEMVMGAFTVRGTHKGEIWGLAPTGNRIVFKAVDLWRFETGKIAQRCFASVDRLDILQQLGCLPAPQNGK